MASDFSVAWQISQRETIGFRYRSSFTPMRPVLKKTNVPELAKSDLGKLARLLKILSMVQ
jgi:hypothetical protein